MQYWLGLSLVIRLYDASFFVTTGTNKKKLIHNYKNLSLLLLLLLLFATKNLFLLFIRFLYFL